VKVNDRNLKQLKIGVLMGGLSSERAISLMTGKGVYNELKKNGHNVVSLDIDSYSLDKIIKSKIDVAFIALHGTYGEDGVIQGILEFLRIPYTGSGVLASALAMNKEKTQEILEYNGIAVPEWTVIKEKQELNKIKIKYPVVLKPVCEGSAVGVFIVKNLKEAKNKFLKVKKFGGAVMVQKYIEGTEISVPILGEKVLPIIEIIPANKFYDYDAKYTPGKSKHIIPARITSDITKKAGAIAKKVHELLGCKDMSRTDIIVQGNKLYVLETNTIPGMTAVSLLPEAAKAAGISFYEMIVILLKRTLGRKSS